MTASTASTTLNINDIRAILSEEISKIREGQQTAANVNAIVNAVGKIFTSVKMEMEYGRLTGRTPQIAILDVNIPKLAPPK